MGSILMHISLTIGWATLPFLKNFKYKRNFLVQYDEVHLYLKQVWTSNVRQSHSYLIGQLLSFEEALDWVWHCPLPEGPLGGCFDCGSIYLINVEIVFFFFSFLKGNVRMLKGLFESGRINILPLYTRMSKHWTVWD